MPADIWFTVILFSFFGAHQAAICSTIDRSRKGAWVIEWGAGTIGGCGLTLLTMCLLLLRASHHFWLIPIMTLVAIVAAYLGWRLPWPPKRKSSHRREPPATPAQWREFAARYAFRVFVICMGFQVLTFSLFPGLMVATRIEELILGSMTILDTILAAIALVLGRLASPRPAQ